MTAEVERFFSDQSPLAEKVASFRPRAQQRDMGADPQPGRDQRVDRRQERGDRPAHKRPDREPAGRHVIKVCRAEACQSMGANELVGMIERFLKVKLGQTTADGAITLEAAYCLGNCALSPAVMVDDRLVGRVDAKKFEKIVAECRS